MEKKIGKNSKIAGNVIIDVREKFRLGDRSIIGAESEFSGRLIEIGDDFYGSGKLKIGPGRKNWPDAICKIGNRCVMHDNIIDTFKEVIIGDDVGLSPEVTIYTHGYWLSILEGYPARHAPVKIGNGVIVGYRSVILSGVTIGDNAVIGAQSVVTRDVEPHSVYAGNPAKKVKEIVPLSREEKEKKLKEIISEYMRVAKYRGLTPFINVEYPVVWINGFVVNVETLEHSGVESTETDDFRDFIFRYGIRIYTNRPFKTFFREH